MPSTNIPYTDVRDRNADSLIHFACEGGHKEIVQYLVETLKCDVGKKVFVDTYYIHTNASFKITLSRGLICGCPYYSQNCTV